MARGSSRTGPLASRSSISLNVLATLVLCIASFYAGSLWGMQVTVDRSNCNEPPHRLSQREKDQQAALRKSAEAQKERRQQEKDAPPTLPSTVERYVTGMVRTSRDDFTTLIDLGVPIDETQRGMEEVLIFYSSQTAQPSLELGKGKLSSQQALQNCETLQVMLMGYGQKHQQQCLAIVPQYESFHIQKYMRVDPLNEKSPVDPNLPLTLVSRSYEDNGKQHFLPPKFNKHTQQLWDILGNYMENYKKVMGQLKPIAKQAARNNTLVVMVCNFGQSELLINFVCSCKSRGIDLSQVLVFVTDLETKAIVEGLGLHAFYDEANFGSISTKAAGRYGDRQFKAMMMAKVICVHYTVMLGYDVLFQDVDLVWYRNPLDYFDSRKDFDVYFQDDGGHSVRYAPYSANSGFYFVRNNDRTKYLFSALLQNGDVIFKTDSHQQALIALLSEHSSLFGLRVKVLNRREPEFPGGYHYHMSKLFMKSLFSGQAKPYIFHMSWTLNKDNKLLFFRQLGEWYVQDQCIAASAETILSTSASLSDACCSATALFSCHYRDKPSKLPCNDSPPIDAGRESWW